MPRRKLILYAISIICLIILAGINTRHAIRKIDKSNYDDDVKYGFQYMLVFTKLILIMDVFYFSSFYFSKTINTIIQIKVIKIISMIIWIYIGTRLGFSAGIIAYLSCKLFSYILLYLFQKEESHIAYHLYNLRVSLDLRIIKAYVVSKIVEALKSTAAVCAILLLLWDYVIISSDKYVLLFYVKNVFLLVDRILYKWMEDEKKFYNISAGLMFVLNALGISAITPLVVKYGFKRQPVFIFNETILLSVVILLFYYIHLNKKYQNMN